jgi:hypothetical protein
MANKTLRALFDEIAALLQDEGFTNWTETEFVSWYNLSAREVVVANPDANAVIESVKLVSGVKQDLPSGVLEFIRAVSNMGTDGLTRGEAITPSTIDLISAFDRNWATATATVAIKHAMKEQGGYWYNYPPSDGTGCVEIEVSKVPTQISFDDAGAWESALVGVDDKYVGPLMERMMAYCYSKDTDFPGSEERAAKHLGLFQQGVGGKAA